MIYKKQKLVAGIGVNDADYAVQPVTNGRQEKCPFYRAWQNMLIRCYDPKEHARHPTYAGCVVADEWFSFMAFKEWMEAQDWAGKQLDKDIIQPGNKTYSERYCCFVSDEVNKLLTNNAAKRGEYPQGVTFMKDRGKFAAKLSINNIQKLIGYYTTPESAYAAYRQAKVKRILNIAEEQTDLRVANGLRLHAKLLDKNLSTYARTRQ